jgi:phosphoglycolate phosphatase-like HAD superfamily hydrolase
MNSILAIFFDFDGVILDSMHLKLESYCFALQQYKFPRSEIKRIQLRLAGLSRHEVISTIVSELNGTPPSIDEARQLGERFAEHDDSLISAMKPVPGTIEFLNLVSCDYFTAIITGTPQLSINKVVNIHNLGKYFNSVNGSPETKPSIIQRLLKSNDFKIEDAVFIGDGKTDQDAANESGIRFIGLKREGCSFIERNAWKVINDLRDLLPTFKKV